MITIYTTSLLKFPKAINHIFFDWQIQELEFNQFQLETNKVHIFHNTKVPIDRLNYEHTVNKTVAINCNQHRFDLLKANLGMLPGFSTLQSRKSTRKITRGHLFLLIGTCKSNFDSKLLLLIVY